MVKRGILTGILLLAVGVASTLAGFLLYSETALRWIVNAGLSALPASASTIEGRLIGPLRVEDIRFQQEGLRVRIASLRLDWEPRALLEGEIRLSLVEAAGIHITLPRPAPSESSNDAPFELADISLPVAIALERLVLKEVTVRGADAEAPFRLSRVAASMNFDRRVMLLEALELEGPQLNFSASGELRPQGAYPLGMDAAFELRPGQYPAIAGTLQVSGDLERLAIRQDLSRPVRASMRAVVEDVAAGPTWDARLEMGRLGLGALDPAWEPLILEGNARSRGSPSSFTVEAALRGDYQALSWRADLNARHQNGEWHVPGLSLELPQRGAQLSLKGRAVLTTDHQSVALEGDWRNLAWPLRGGEPRVVSPTGRLSLKGALDDYRFEIGGDVRGAAIPPGQWLLAGTGSTAGIELRRLDGAVLGGHLTGTLAVSWARDLLWRFSLEGRGLDPSARWAGVPERLDFSVHGDGALRDGQYTARVGLEELSGALNGAPLSGWGHIEVAQRQISLSPLVLRAGESHLVAAGELGEQWSLSWRIDAPDLRQFYPPLAGDIESQGSVSGARGSLTVAGTLRGHGLAYGEHRAEYVSVALDWDPGDIKPSHVAIHLVDVEAGGQHIRQLDVRGSGRASQHTVYIWLDTAWAQAAGRVQGGYGEDVWQGEVDGVRLELPPTGAWESEQAALVRVGGDIFDLAPWCLAGTEGARLCLDGRWNSRQGGEANITAGKVPLQIAGRWLPADIAINGRGRLGMHAVLSPEGGIEGTASFVSEEGELAFEVTREDTVRISYKDFEVDTRLRQGVASLSVSADLGEQGGLDGNLQLPLAVLNPVSSQVSGTFEASLREFGMLTLLMPEAEGIQGDLRASARLSGSPDDVEFNVDLDFSKGRIAFPALGITVDDIAMRIRPDGARANALRFEGGARSGGGNITARGSFLPGDAHDWRLDLDVGGDRFQVINNAEYQVVVSPDVTLTVSHDAATVSGVVTVPEAVLKPKSLSGAVRPSRDAIVVSEEAGAEERFAVFSNVRIRLGDYVRFDGFGLKGFITGQLQVVDKPGQLTSGTGELGIREGRFKAYGQDLVIERGRLVFVGGPIDTPGLDIRAIRKVEEVTVGFNVSGDIVEPRLKIFSSPAMSETEALSYLVLGRPLDRNDTSKGNELSGAALALGVGGASLLGKKFGEGLGIDEVGIETKSGTGEIQLKMGTYLSPKLYVGYSRSLAEQLNIYMVRYRLSKSLTVSGESSNKAVGGDLLYTIEKD